MVKLAQIELGMMRHTMYEVKKSRGLDPKAKLVRARTGMARLRERTVRASGPEPEDVSASLECTKGDKVTVDRGGG